MVRPERTRILASAARHPNRSRAPQLLDSGLQASRCTEGDTLRGRKHDPAWGDAAAELPQAASGGEGDTARALGLKSKRKRRSSGREQKRNRETSDACAEPDRLSAVGTMLRRALARLAGARPSMKLVRWRKIGRTTIQLRANTRQ